MLILANIFAVVNGSINNATTTPTTATTTTTTTSVRDMSGTPTNPHFMSCTQLLDTYTYSHNKSDT